MSVIWARSSSAAGLTTRSGMCAPPWMPRSGAPVHCESRWTAGQLRESSKRHAMCVECSPNSGTYEDLRLDLRRGRWRSGADIHRRMEVELRRTIEQTIDRCNDVVFIEVTGLKKADQTISGLESVFAHPSMDAAR